MGNSLNHNIWFNKSKRKIILLGFENSGKSSKTICYFHLMAPIAFLEIVKSGKFFDQYTPSADFEMYEKKAFGQVWLMFVSNKIFKIVITLKDLAGGVRQRVFWRHHFSGTQGVIYFIDVSESDEKVKESIKELKKIVAEPELRNTSFLVYLNKIDKLSKGFSRDSLVEKYDLKDFLKDPRIYVEVCCLKTDLRVKEGLDWLSKNMIPL